MISFAQLNEHSMKNPKIDAFLSEATQWQAELACLRSILLECNLQEELKWGNPCYCFQKKNIILLGGFKDHCVISFIKGTLLKDEEGVLVKPGENSQSVRFIRFTSVKEITDLASTIKAYIFEAIEVEKAGLSVKLKTIDEYPLPEELKSKLEEHPALHKAFYALTDGRQRAYIMYFSDSKQSSTRLTRIERYTQRILDGYGINDCVCGLSKRKPSCDGSHKQLKEQ